MVAAPADSGGGLNTGSGEITCGSDDAAGTDAGRDPMRLRGGGGGGMAPRPLPSSLAEDERDSVDVQPLARPPTPGLRWESLGARGPPPPRRELTGVRRKLCPLSISSTYLRKSRSSWKP